MKIIGSVVLALMAGILTCVNALKDMQSICLRNGGTQAVEDAKNFTASLTATCHKSVQTISLRNFAELTTNCTESGTAIKCAIGLAKMAEICGRPDQRMLFEVAQNAVNATHNFVCENEKRINKIYESADRNCFSINAQALIHCFGKHLLGKNSQDFDQLPTGITHPTALLLNLDPDFNGKTRSNLEDFEQCGVKVMEECKDKGFSELLKSLFKHVNNELPCEKLSKTPKLKSKALSVNVVNILLLFHAGIIVMFVQFTKF